MPEPVEIDITEPSDLAATVFSAHYVLIVFAFVGVGIAAGEVFFDKAASTGHFWETYVAGPAVSLLMLFYAALYLRMDYAADYWRAHAWAGALFSASRDRWRSGRTRFAVRVDLGVPARFRDLSDDLFADHHGRAWPLGLGAWITRRTCRERTT